MYCRTIKAETDSGTGTPGKKTPGKASASVKTPGTGKVSASIKTPGTGKITAPGITKKSVTRVDPVTGDLTMDDINQRGGDPGEAEG